MPPLPASVHDLRTLVLSRHAAILLDMPEEDRTEALVAAVGRDLHLPARLLPGGGVIGDGLPFVQDAAGAAA